MELDVQRGTAATWVRVCGDVDVLTVPDLRIVLHDAIDAAPWQDLVVDLAGVTLLDATGLGVLVGAHRRAGRHSRRLELHDPPFRIRRLLALTRLDRVLAVTSSAALEPVA
jgi:anti-sigma B factor antagonist